MLSKRFMQPKRAFSAGSTWNRWFLGLALMLGSLVGGGCATAPSRPPGTPMKTSCPASVELPTIEECLDEAAEIEDELLMSCVRRQCRDITVTCSEWNRQKCKAQSQRFGNSVLAFTVTNWRGTLHRFYPVAETHWCEEPASRGCIIQAVIHELAHSCGWDHGQGQNVPGNEPERQPPAECACPDENGARTSCE